MSYASVTELETSCCFSLNLVYGKSLKVLPHTYMGNIISMNHLHCICFLPDVSSRASNEVVCAVPFLHGCLMAGIGTSTWVSQLPAEFHTYITPIPESAGQKHLCRALLSC